MYLISRKIYYRMETSLCKHTTNNVTIFRNYLHKKGKSNDGTYPSDVDRLYAFPSFRKWIPSVSGVFIFHINPGLFTG